MILVAGIGNIFCGDDGFGVEVARRLDPARFPDGVRIADYGISGMHLAYDLLTGYDVTILIDAVSRAEKPGTLLTIELDTVAVSEAPDYVDGHGMQPEAVVEMVRMLGGTMGRTLLVGCCPADLGEHIGLSPVVERAADEAVGIVTRLACSESDRLAALEV